MVGLGPVATVLVGLLSLFATVSFGLAGFLDRNRAVERCTSSREHPSASPPLDRDRAPLPLIGAPLLTVSCMLYMLAGTTRWRLPRASECTSRHESANGARAETTQRVTR